MRSIFWCGACFKACNHVREGRIFEEASLLAKLDEFEGATMPDIAPLPLVPVFRVP